MGGASDTSSSHPTSPLSPKFSAPPIRSAALKTMFPQVHQSYVIYCREIVSSMRALHDEVEFQRLTTFSSHIVFMLIKAFLWLVLTTMIPCVNMVD